MLLDHIMTVSELTRRTVIEKYNRIPGQSNYSTQRRRTFIGRRDFHKTPCKDKVVTFLGRITMQKDLSILWKQQYLVLQNNPKIL